MGQDRGGAKGKVMGTSEGVGKWIGKQEMEHETGKGMGNRNVKVVGKRKGVGKRDASPFSR